MLAVNQLDLHLVPLVINPAMLIRVAVTKWCNAVRIQKNRGGGAAAQAGECRRDLQPSEAHYR